MSVSRTAKSIFFETGKNNRLLSFRTFNLIYSPLGWLILHRLIHDRDMKILITSKGNTTGTGKTTLEIYLAREIRRWVNDLFNRQGLWSADKYAFMDEKEYIRKYLSSETGDILVTDELERMVDNRRSMSHGNVEFTQLWMEMRFLNVITIGSSPGLHTLDIRIPQNTDIWINVVEPGRAYVYFLTVNDFTGEPIETRLKLKGFRQQLLWTPPDNDPDYNLLKQMKKKDATRYLQWEDNISKEDLKNAKSETVDNIIMSILEANRDMDLGLTQEQIADHLLDGVRSQQHISKINRKLTE